MLPDRTTTARMVPLSKERMIGVVIAAVYKGFSHSRLNTNARYAALRMQRYLEPKNMLCQLGPEVECFILDDIKFSIDGKQEPISSHASRKGLANIR